MSEARFCLLEMPKGRSEYLLQEIFQYGGGEVGKGNYIGSFFAVRASTWDPGRFMTSNVISVFKRKE